MIDVPQQFQEDIVVVGAVTVVDVDAVVDAVIVRIE
jgi:hypothetical protein